MVDQPASASAPSPSATPTTWERWRNPVLFASLAINLFLAGLLVGGWVHQGRHDGMRHMARMMMHQQMGQPGQMGRMRHDGERRGPGAAGAPSTQGPGFSTIREAIAGLPEADQKSFNDTLDAQRSQMMKLRQEVRELRFKVNSAITAEPFDKAKFLEALAAVRAKIQEMQSTLHTGMAEAVGKLSKESRAQFAESLAQARARRQ